MSYQENYKMQHINFPFNNDAFQAKFRFNLDKDETLANIKADTCGDAKGSEVQDFVCKRITAQFQNYYYDYEGNYK